MKVCALSSGSSGNCFYIEKNDSAILVDAGISAKKVIERMAFSGLDPEKIKAIFITHEHSDHVKGADVLSRKLNVPIYATKGTIYNSFLCSNKENIISIKNEELISLPDMDVHSFSKSHSAAEPVSYSIYDREKVVSVITDAGYACDNINSNIAISDFLFLESNHDVKMLESGPYPEYLKKWIKGDGGHLSNVQAGYAVLNSGSSRLRNVVLSHISKTNNSPGVAIKTFNEMLKNRELKVSASIDEMPTEVFKI